MKKCHLCGTIREDSEKTFRELDEECYCIFCLDEDGKPRNPNTVRMSIINFWGKRTSRDKESEEHIT